MKKLLLRQFITISLIATVLSITAASSEICTSREQISCYKLLLALEKSDNQMKAAKHYTLSEVFISPLIQQDGGLFDKRTIRDLNVVIALMQSSDDPDEIAKGNRLKSLAYGILPTIYLRNGIQNLKGEDSPLRIDSDVNSISKLYEDNSLFSKIEYITVRIENENDLNTILDLVRIGNFSHLKYISFLCSFKICSAPNCEAGVISRMLEGTGNADLEILYTISIPE